MTRSAPSHELCRFQSVRLTAPTLRAGRDRLPVICRARRFRSPPLPVAGQAPCWRRVTPRPMMVIFGLAIVDILDLFSQTGRYWQIILQTGKDREWSRFHRASPLSSCCASPPSSSASSSLRLTFARPAPCRRRRAYPDDAGSASTSTRCIRRPPPTPRRCADVPGARTRYSASLMPAVAMGEACQQMRGDHASRRTSGLRSQRLRRTPPSVRRQLAHVVQQRCRVQVRDRECRLRVQRAERSSCAAARPTGMRSKRASACGVRTARSLGQFFRQYARMDAAPELAYAIARASEGAIRVCGA